MSYIYCVKVTPESQDDVNAKFRELDLGGELLVSQANEFYISPQLSYTKWSAFPQSKQAGGTIDSGWDKAIDETVAYLVKAYGMAQPSVKADWQKFESSYRCSKMESFLRELDINN